MDEQEINLISEWDDKVEAKKPNVGNREYRNPNIIYEIGEFFDTIDDKNMKKQISSRLIAKICAYACAGLCLCVIICNIFLIAFILSISTLIK